MTAWYSGKPNLVGLAIGDSNMVGFGGFELNVQDNNPNVQCYATTEAIPYNPAELAWRQLDPNGTSREEQVVQSLYTQNVTYVGQMLGGNGNSAMQMASTIQQRTGCDTFWLYTGAKGGAKASDYIVGGEPWTSTLANFPAALAAVPGSPTYADVIFICLSSNDIFWGVTAEQYYDNIVIVRSQMIAEGWWVPGVTQIVLIETPPLNPEIYPSVTGWDGVHFVVSRLDDRITYIPNTGMETNEPVFRVHYTPASLTNIGEDAGNRVFAHVPVPWFHGKTAIACACIGDSNALGSGGFTPPGGQTANTGVYCYASASGQTPYDEANMGWRNLDPNGTARIDEYTSYLATVGNIGFIGQMLGGNGNSGMQAASTVEQDIHLDNYLYQCAAGGTTADFWANGDGWDTLERTIPTALESIPGSPTAFDYILFSLGGNDAIQDYTAEQFYTHFKTLRTKMVAAGWWIPGTTQIIILDTPKSGSFADDYSDWEGLTEVLTRFNDLIAVTDSIGYELDPAMDVHYLPPYYSDAGVQAGELVLSDIQRKPKTLSVGGTRVTIGGYAIQIYGTAA